MVKKDTPRGLGGWLILLGIWIVFAMWVEWVGYLRISIPMFSYPITELFSSSSNYYDPFFGVLVVSRLIITTLQLLVSIYLIYLYFAKKQLFPKILMVVLVANPVLHLYRGWSKSVSHPEEAVFSLTIVLSICTGLIICAIWIPYLIRSKRVKATFINKICSKSRAGSLCV